MSSSLRARLARVLIMCVCLGPLAACFDEEEEKQRQAQAQWRAQLDAEQVRRRAAEQSRDAWIVGLGAGTLGLCVLTGLPGVHIGVRAVPRPGKERADG